MDVDIKYWTKAKRNYIRLDREVDTKMHRIIIILLSSINLGRGKVKGCSAQITTSITH